jgi:argininosuccinate lyase
MADVREDSRLAALGVGGRLEEGAGRELIESAGRLEAGDAAILDAGLHAADMAHAIALVEAGVIPADVATRLVRLLLEMRRVPHAERPADPALGDGFANREAWMAAHDAEAAGWLCAGRARREGTTTAYHIAVRERLLALGDALRAAGVRLVTLAEAHVDTLTLDYTYLQQAQPTTLAHYLLGFAHPLLRDLDRLRACYARTNLSPAGVGGINGARWPLDRSRIAALLGFDGVVTHARDGMWQADQPIEVMSVVVAALVNLDRLAEDLQVWSTTEFGLVELADRHARGSMVMPQKKNPYALAFVRGTASAMIGRLAGVAALGRTPSGQVDNRIFAYGEVPRALDLATETARLMAGVLSGLAVDRPRMAGRASASFAQATDLAEALVTAAGLDYRAAHRVVGRAVGLAVARGLGPGDLSPALLDEAARAVLGRAVEVDAACVRDALDAGAAVAGRTGLGGAAPAAVRDMLAECTGRLAAAGRWHADATSRLHAAATALETRARELSGPGQEPVHTAFAPRDARPRSSVA